MNELSICMDLYVCKSCVVCVCVCVCVCLCLSVCLYIYMLLKNELKKYDVVLLMLLFIFVGRIKMWRCSKWHTMCFGKYTRRVMYLAI
jgi:hypothetical protein